MKESKKSGPILFSFQIFEEMDKRSLHSKYWMPLVWAGSMLQKARQDNRIGHDAMLLAMVNEINRIRSVSGDLLNYDWVNIPLVYTQVFLRKFAVQISFMIFKN